MRPRAGALSADDRGGNCAEVKEVGTLVTLVGIGLEIIGIAITATGLADSWREINQGHNRLRPAVDLDVGKLVKEIINHPLPIWF